MTGTAAASDWRAIGAIAEGGTDTMDVASLTRQGNIVRGWLRIVFAEPRETAGDKYWAVRYRHYYDCATRRIASKQTTSFADKDFSKVVYSGPNTDDALLEWEDVAPDSVAEAWLKFACSKAPK